MNWHELNLPFDNPLNPRFTLPDTNGITEPWTIWLPDIDTFLSTELKAWFKTINCMPHFAHLFYGLPGAECKIHTDGIKNPVPAAINWVFTGKQSDMIWYDKLEEGNVEYVVGSKREHIFWHEHQVTEIDRHRIKRPCLVRTDIPHKVVNYDMIPRWCISVRFWPGQSWPKTVAMLHDYILPP